MGEKNKEEIVKQALEREYLNEITKELNERITKQGLETYLRGNVSFEDGEVQITFSFYEKAQDNLQILKTMISYLASQLSKTKTELWLKEYQATKEK
jgi:hypothetical protein